MPKIAKPMGALEVGRLKTPGRHRVGVIPGLQLMIRDSGAKYWVLRVTVGNKRRDMGLGSYPAVTLAMAHEAARQACKKIADGIDPIDDARAKDSALRAAQAMAVTFKDAADTYIKSHRASWKNAKHAQQWANTLETYAYPVVGSLYVRDIKQAHVLKILEPIWLEKTETATRVRGRIESVLDWAKGRGYMCGDNPAAWKGNLDAQLARPEKVAKAEHHAALPVSEVGAFMARLRRADGTGARALEFAILTAARSGEVRGATWAEIDMSAKVWTVPATRMKVSKEHRVPLSDTAVKLLEALSVMEGTDLVFPAPRGGTLSDMTLTAVLRRMEVDAVPHGFRSTFRDWVSERTNYPREAAEMALAHAIGDKVEAAYRRGDLFEKRRKMMVDWAHFCGQIAPVSANVIPLAQRA